MIFEFDGQRLDQLFIASNLKLQLPQPTPYLVTVQGRDGQAVRGAVLGAGSVSVELSKHGGTEDARRAAVSTLWQMMNTDEAKQLRIDSVSGPYYMAIPSGGGDMTFYIEAESIPVQFALVEPARYGATRSATLSGSAAQTITIDGTYATWLKIESTDAVRNVSGLWGVRVDDQKFVCVEVPTSTASAVTIDCGAHLAEINGAAVLVTLQSDWLKLEPGEHTIKIDKGSGTATVTWTEMWL